MQVNKVTIAKPVQPKDMKFGPGDVLVKIDDPKKEVRVTGINLERTTYSVKNDIAKFVLPVEVVEKTYKLKTK